MKSACQCVHAEGLISSLPETSIERAPTPDTVNLNLAFVEVPGSFKISAYNASGESPLSAGTLTY